MDAQEALADLAEISAQIIDAAILDDTSALASSIADSARAASFAAGARALLAEGERQAAARGQELEALEVTSGAGSVFVVRGAGRLIAATARPDAIAGLVVYDLRRCLERLDAGADREPTPVRRPRRPSRPAADIESGSEVDGAA